MNRRWILLLWGIGVCLQAGVTGKLAGTTRDQETHEPLIGVNVLLVGTDMGAATDTQGRFVILNVPPGVYTVKASIIGYHDVLVKGVEIRIDQTTTLDLELSLTTLELEAVEVTAERPLVEPDISASQLNMSSDVIENLPVKSITQVINLQAGIENLAIRGGSQSQSAYLVDGFLMNDERSNIPYTSTALNAVKEIQIQTGGFNAEYGNIRSGVINVVTKEGDPDEYHGAVTLRYSPPQPKHFGPSVYDPESYFLRPYLDTTVCWTGTDNGAWDAYTQGQYPSFEGWIAISEGTLNDDDPANDLTPEGARRLFEWQHRRQGDIKKPDQTLDLALGGPVPFLSRWNHWRFYFSHQQDETQFVFPLSLDGYTEGVSRLKLTADITRKIKLTLNGQTGLIQSVSPYSWKVTPTGSVLKSTYSVADLINSSSGNSVLFMPGYYSPTEIRRNMVGAKWNHVLDNTRYYEVLLQWMENRYNTYQLPQRDTSRVYEIVDGYFVDEAPYGYWGYGVTGIDGMSIGGWMNLGRDRTRNLTFIAKVDFVNQINAHNQIKTGLDYVRNAYHVRSSTENPSMSTWNRSLVYDVFPYRLAFYLQDKIEYRAFIANVGLRWESSSANTHLYQLEDYDDFFKQGLGNKIEEEAPVVPSKTRQTLSPRLGVSHPITETSKLYFNYGHFYSEPASSYRFRLQRESNGLVTHIGNPNLDLEKTVAYELGLAKSFRHAFLLNVAAYYKDVTNQAGWIYYQNINSSVQYHKAANNNYEDIRGFEVTLSKSIGQWFSGFVNYTYMVKTSGYFGLTRYYQDPNEQRDYERINPYQSRPHPQPYARANLNFMTPARFGPRLPGIGYVLGDWVLNVIGTYKAGAYSTYNPDNIPGVVDNIQWVDRYLMDVKLAKTFRVNTSRVDLFLDVTNVFNTRYLSYAGFVNTYDYIDYIESLHFDWEEGTEHGHDRVGDYRKPGVPYQPFHPADPDHLTPEEKQILKDKAYINMPNLKSLTFLDPRDITFGITVAF
ncbi:MAG: TonB-dependent receptor [Candidatus Neomarinimicrobiota bacterium]|nr:MAG: TonB-dependent receptor [Candidatus Neomarinimicrobiota bacterium]